MSGYTDKEAATFYATIFPYHAHTRADYDKARYGRSFLGKLERAGIKVVFPKPRYYVERTGSGAGFQVREYHPHNSDWSLDSVFYGLNAEADAEARAALLNRKEGAT